MIQRDLNNSDSVSETEKTFETFLETRCTQVPRRMDVSRMDVWMDVSRTNKVCLNLDGFSDLSYLQFYFPDHIFF